MPNAFANLTNGHSIEPRVLIEGGGYRVAIGLPGALHTPGPHRVRRVAVGRPARFLVAFCAAHAKALTAGAVHEKQLRMAHRCVALLGAFAEKGIEAMVDEACGVLVRGHASPAPAVRIGTVDELRAMLREESNQRCARSVAR